MQTNFERWLASQNISTQSLNLFTESTACYKAGAYRAALLFSYLGFLTTVKERILLGTLPPGFPVQLWTDLRTKLNYSEGWDKTTYECIGRKNPAPIFILSESIIREVDYWKDRRNDCAHSKHEKIEYHHVESFWSFLENNFSKFVVNGGLPALVQKFKDHYNPSLTSPGTDLTPLIEEIEGAVDPTSINSFYTSIENDLTAYSPYLTEETFEVFSKILIRYNNYISDTLLAYLKAEDSKLLSFLKSYPNTLVHFNLTDQQIRNLWYSQLFTGPGDSYELFLSLINLVPPQEKAEALSRAARKVTTVPTPSQSIQLQALGFYLPLAENIFPSTGYSNFETGNRNRNLIVHYIDKYPIDERIVRSLCATYATSAYRPNHLESMLTTYFSNNQLKKDEFITLMNGLNPRPPLGTKMRGILGLQP